MNVTRPGMVTDQRGLLYSAAEKAASAVGVRLYNLRDSGKGIAFTLKTGAPSEMREDWRGKMKLQAKYQRLAARAVRSTAKDTPGVIYYPTVPGAVCWHGHRDFLRAFYALVPDAKIRTAFITYKGAEHFEDSHESTYDGAPEKARGSYAGFARPYEDACTCLSD